MGNAPTTGEAPEQPAQPATPEPTPEEDLAYAQEAYAGDVRLAMAAQDRRAIRALLRKQTTREMGTSTPAPVAKPEPVEPPAPAPKAEETSVWSFPSMSLWGENTATAPDAGAAAAPAPSNDEAKVASPASPGRESDVWSDDGATTVVDDAATVYDDAVSVAPPPPPPDEETATCFAQRLTLVSAKSCRACEVLRGGGAEADDSADDAAAAARAAAAAEAARTCAICLDSVDLRDVKFDVRCGHKFHPACLQEYIAKYDAGEVVLDSTHPGAVCPVCRERLIVDLAPPWRTWFAPSPAPPKPELA